MDDLIKLANLLHTLSCIKPHVDDMQLLLQPRDANSCYFYVEETLADNAQKPDHDLWKGEAEKLCKELSTSPTEVIRLLTSLLDLRRRLDDILMRYPNAANFARLVLLDASR